MLEGLLAEAQANQEVLADMDQFYASLYDNADKDFVPTQYLDTESLQSTKTEEIYPISRTGTQQN
jgi:hypothetical protein